MLRLGEIKNAKGATRQTKRLGRGVGTGQGGTAGKGNKGQLARTGGKVRRGFEGGQMPLFRRLPKRGFNNDVFSVKYAVINLRDLNKGELKEISLESLKTAGLLKTTLKKLKVLGTGDVNIKFNIKTHAISASAKQKVEKAGGTVEILKG